MKSSLPKIFIITVISILIFPQVSFAAWWNPFTWKIFKRVSEVKIEKTINTPENKLGAEFSASSSPKQLNTTDQTAEIEKLKKEVNELKKKTNFSTIIPSNSLKTEENSAESSNVSDNNQSKGQNLYGRYADLVPKESWANLEYRYFLEADQKGWASLTITNELGDKRFYRKEGNQWVRKNSETEAQQPDYTILLNNLLQSIIKTELDSYQKFLSEEKVIAEKSKPLWDQIKQIENEELQKGCVNPDGAMSFITGQKWSECNKLSLDKAHIADQIAVINHTLPYIRPTPPPPPQAWIINRTTKTISTQDGSSKYYYICTSAECRINPY